ncbi:hypothetical protein [Streptomyces viridochromogenes]|uniref:hypothetical protein n=1 Tax=Streptomyces viridochromogenes TaxID=1938 RepID=UPI0005867E1E|nr:hypothetical protein [Streptomyces viridochromogenes]
MPGSSPYSVKKRFQPAAVLVDGVVALLEAVQDLGGARHPLLVAYDGREVGEVVDGLFSSHVAAMAF